MALENTDLVSQTSTAVGDALLNAVSYIPNIVIALLIVLVGVIVGWAAKTVVVYVFQAINIKPYVEKTGLGKAFEAKVNFTELIGDLVKWIVVIAFLLPAFDVLGLNQVNALLEKVVAYLPQVVAAVIIVMIGSIVADLAGKVVENTAKTIGASTAKVLADITKYSVIIFVVLAALEQLGIAPTMLDRLFTAIVGMVAIAGGIAFGLGGQDSARDAVNRLRKNL